MVSIMTADASSVADTVTYAPEDTDPEGSPAPLGAGQVARSDGAIDPARVRLFRGPWGVLRCTVEGEKSVLSAKVVRVFPMARDSRWINVLDWKNKEVCLIEDASTLDPVSRQVVEEELRAHYRVARISRILLYDGFAG